MGPCRSLLLDRREVLRSGEHHESRRRSAAIAGQAVSRFRPRARRAARIRRPAVVFMRARKPCSLARWRFLGWYVCFIQAVLRSSRSGLGDGSLRLPLEARKRAGAPRDTWRVVVRRMIGPLQSGCQTLGRPPRERPTPRLDPSGSCSWDVIDGCARIPPGSMCESPCDAILAGAILSGPSAPETFAGDASRPRGGAQAAVVRPRRKDVDRTSHRPRATTGTLARRSCPYPSNPERRSYRTNGRQAGLASRPG